MPELGSSVNKLELDLFKSTPRGLREQRPPQRNAALLCPRNRSLLQDRTQNSVLQIFIEGVYCKRRSKPATAAES